jgi:hypothetical protein
MGEFRRAAESVERGFLSRGGGSWQCRKPIASACLHYINLYFIDLTRTLRKESSWHGKEIKVQAQWHRVGGLDSKAYQLFQFKRLAVDALLEALV